MSTSSIIFGLDSFGDLPLGEDGALLSHAAAIRHVVTEAIADDERGMDVIAIIGGPPERFAPFVDLYRRAAKEFGTDPNEVGIHSPGHIADTDEEALETYWPAIKIHRDRVGRSRGWSPMTREQFDDEVAYGSLYVGSPETVAHKIASTVQALDVNRFDLVYGFGPLPAGARLRNVELYGEQVIPQVRALLATA